MNSIRALFFLFSTVSLAACGSGDATPVNSAPVASKVAVQDVNGGEVWVGDELVGSYRYNDVDGDPEGLTEYYWLRNGIPVSGANTTSYTVAEEDAGQSISLEVLPVAQTGAAIGTAVDSAGISVDYFVGTRLPAQSFPSIYTGGTYTVSIYLPAGYENSAQDYPVIYQVGSESGYNLHADILEAKARQVILVSVETDVDRRWEDTTMPGARLFYDFFVLELIPFIDTQYRTNKGNRTFVGHSLAGLFVGLAMLFEPPGARNFLAFISSDGSFWNQSEETIALAQQLAERTNELPVTLILTSASAETGNEHSVARFGRVMAQSDYAGFEQFYFPFDLLHSEVYGPSLRAAIDILFP
jgi:predicted alpha/beta superfamily hydrolase